VIDYNLRNYKATGFPMKRNWNYLRPYTAWKGNQKQNNLISRKLKNTRNMGTQN
jgi:hypothetical protein